MFSQWLPLTILWVGIQSGGGKKNSNYVSRNKPVFFFTPRFLNNEVRGKSNRDMYDILGCEQVCVCPRVCVRTCVAQGGPNRLPDKAISPLWLR